MYTSFINMYTYFAVNIRQEKIKNNLSFNIITTFKKSLRTSNTKASKYQRVLTGQTSRIDLSEFTIKYLVRLK